MTTPEEVFITDGFPRLTYVDPGGGKPEADLKEGLAQENKIISIVGASKTGKSTLCDKHFGSGRILVTGDQIKNPDVMWSEAYRQIGGQVTSGYAMNVLGATIEAIVAKGIPMLLDDFHYVEAEVQRTICQQMKNAAARRLRFVVLNTPQRGDDPVRNNPDLAGRFFTVDLGFWSSDELSEIGRKGFPQVGLKVTEEVLRILADEALGSPQLMQTLCLETCRVLPQDVPYEQQSVDKDTFNLAAVKAKTGRSYGFDTELHYLREGPKERGRERNTFKFADGESGDVYNALVRALAADPAFVSIGIDEIKARIKKTVVDGGTPNVAAALTYVNDLFGARRPIEWDEQKQRLSIVDPHFYYYLRLKGR